MLILDLIQDLIQGFASVLFLIIAAVVLAYITVKSESNKQSGFSKLCNRKCTSCWENKSCIFVKENTKTRTRG